jgi:hypothetical protein
VQRHPSPLLTALRQVVYMLSTAFPRELFARFFAGVARPGAAEAGAPPALRWVVSSKAIPADLLAEHGAWAKQQQQQEEEQQQQQQQYPSLGVDARRSGLRLTHCLEQFRPSDNCSKPL